MITVAEMLKPAVWLDWADAYRVCMVLRSNSKLGVFVVPPDSEFDGYRIMLLTHGKNRTSAFVSMGLVAALCSRHDLPADDPKAKKFYGPRFDSFPYFADGLPKERSQAHITGPVHSVGVR